jgi:hypothetical protein
MRFRCFWIFRPCRWLPAVVALALGAGTGLTAAAEETRFSATLSETQRNETGLAQLSADNIAVIDALVRQDEATLKRRGSLPGFGTFSERRNDHEKEIAGLTLLTAAQLNRLDGLAGIRISPPPPSLVQADTPRKAAPGMLVRSAEKPYALEVHGSMSLSYEWSQQGSVRGGGMTVTLQDPAGRFAVTVGYAEYRGKGVMPVYDPTNDPDRYRPAVENAANR